MEQRRTENFTIILMSIGAIGLSIESLILHWEFWVPPLVLVGMAFIWVINILSSIEFRIRKYYYVIFTAIMLFYHGVHETSFFDASLVASLALLVFSFFNHSYMMNLFIMEYAMIMVLQLLMAYQSGSVTFDALNTSRMVLYIIIVTIVYFCCMRMIEDRIEEGTLLKKLEERIEINDADMEDFLSNISHELRTPVNVVNGMSDLLIKKKIGKEAYSIKDAGIRLAYQIEDIQDYTECKRNKVILEEEEYMSTSLINDVVTSFRLLDNSNELELVVDLDPSVPSWMKGDIKKLHKIFRYLLENAVKFTRRGGIYVRMYSENTDYGVNLCIEMTDTGIGMDQKALASLAEGMFQVNKKRNRSTGGIGLGLYIVYGFAHTMGGFVKIESNKNVGTTVRVTIPQKVIDESNCLVLPQTFTGNILFHVRSDKYKVPRVREFYRSMAANLAGGIHVPLYPAETIRDIERFQEKISVTHIFMGQEEYEENPAYFDELSKGDIVVAVSAYPGFSPSKGSRVISMPKPLYAYPVIKIINEGRAAMNIEGFDSTKPMFTNVRALVVDDEPMNLVVATSVFTDYKMIVDTAGSGKEAIRKYHDGNYDVVFMDHMMPEMDGVEAMKKIKKAAEMEGRDAKVIVLTANVLSGAREMFMKEGFDGFIAKPISLTDFERVMMTILPESKIDLGGEGL